MTMQKDSETPIAENSPGVYRGQCRRCNAAYECGAVRFGAELWPFTFYCDPCFDIERAAHDANERNAAAAKRAEAWEFDVGREAFKDTDVARLDAAILARVLAWEHGATGLVLHGPSGLTKSRMMWLLARRIYVEDGVPLMVVRATKLGRNVGDAMAPAVAVEGQIRALISIPVLVIDDLGKEAQSERWESALVEIIDARNAARRPLIVTTNYVGERLVERYRDRSAGEAVVRRLRDFCVAIAFKKDRAAVVR
jgi:DNA replication protein DnaC